ncbi:hypothetical protein JKP88DRAFT_351489 [Tribonema minus]|uniref:EF-hand domain-containing protein n=1 Tax=Tribonema minus TaxID=303371 RepID=A0A835YH25_9STRA|nr:hypothetical protein JKP88DRAFT_351489 [Tribonema minus]
MSGLDWASTASHSALPSARGGSTVKRKAAHSKGAVTALDRALRKFAPLSDPVEAHRLADLQLTQRRGLYPVLFTAHPWCDPSRDGQPREEIEGCGQPRRLNSRFGSFLDGEDEAPVAQLSVLDASQARAHWQALFSEEAPGAPAAALAAVDHHDAGAAAADKGDRWSEIAGTRPALLARMSTLGAGSSVSSITDSDTISSGGGGGSGGGAALLHVLDGGSGGGGAASAERDRFFARYRQAHRLRPHGYGGSGGGGGDNPSPDVGSDENNANFNFNSDARAGEDACARFLRGVLDAGLAPVPLLAHCAGASAAAAAAAAAARPRPGTAPPPPPCALRLAHRGLGDALGLALARALRLLPGLDTLDLRDNRLTDASLVPLVDAAVHLPALTALDLGDNEVDAAAAALRAHLARSGSGGGGGGGGACALRALGLSRADVDDGECAEIMSAVACNTSLTALDLSRNLIGLREAYNAVNPDFQTGGEAVAAMLSVNATLTSLDLSWNGIRGQSAVTLGRALARNGALRVLLLAHNGLNCAGCQAVAHALRRNRALERLDLSFSGMTAKAAMVTASASRSKTRMTAKAAMVMASALLDNTTLTELNVSHNALSRQGGRMLLQALRQRFGAGARLHLDMSSCELATEDASVRFDPHNPSGAYALQLEDAYDYMVAHTLLDCANRSSSVELSAVTWQQQGKQARQKVALQRRGTGAAMDVASSRDANNTAAAAAALGGAGGEAWRAPARRMLSEVFVAGRAATAGDVDALLRALGFAPDATLLARVAAMLNRRNSRRCRGDDGDNGGAPAPAAAEGAASPDANFNFNLKSQAAAAAEPGAVRSEGEVAQALFECLFAASDEDGNRAVDARELRALLAALGDARADASARACLLKYDVDRSGTIEREEFADFMVGTCMTPPRVAPGTLCDASGAPWAIPDGDDSGTLRLTVRAEALTPTEAEPASDGAVDAVLSSIALAAPALADRLSLFQLATAGTDFFMTLAGAQAVLAAWGTAANIVSARRERRARPADVMAVLCAVKFRLDARRRLFAVYRVGVMELLLLLLQAASARGTAVDVMELLLPQMACARSSAALVENNLTLQQKLELRKRLGSAWGPLLGSPTGPYSLDLQDRVDRLAAQRLSAISARERDESQHRSGRSDTSQRGNWHNFRNETLNGAPVRLTSQWLVDPPRRGRLRFDYVSTRRPRLGARPMSDRRFGWLLRCLGLGSLLPLARKGAGSANAAAAAAPAVPVPAGAAERSRDRASERASVGFAAEPSAAERAAERGAGRAVERRSAESSAARARDRAAALLRLPSTVMYRPQQRQQQRASGTSAAAAAAAADDMDDMDGDDNGAASAAAATAATDEERALAGGGGGRVALAEQHARLRAAMAAGEFHAATPERVAALFREWFLTSRRERRRAWELQELGRTVLSEAEEAAEERRLEALAAAREALAAMVATDALAAMVAADGTANATGAAEPPLRATLTRRLTRTGSSLRVPRSSGGASARSTVIMTSPRNTLVAAATVAHGTVTLLGRSRAGTVRRESGSSAQDDASGSGGSTAPAVRISSTTFKESDSSAQDDASGGGESTTSAARPRISKASSVVSNGDGASGARPEEQLRPKSWEDAAPLPRKRGPKPRSPALYAAAVGKLCELQVLALHHFFTAQQVAAIVSAFPPVDGLRPLVATALFDRLLDVGTVDQVLDVLSAEDEEELIWRLGPLNVYSPLRPDRAFDLDLAARDEREVCRILVRLAVTEPGVNWVNETYRWSQRTPPVPGWELPLSWAASESDAAGKATAPGETREGIRTFGRLTLRYTSDPKAGCSPNWAVREELMSRVLAGSARSWS